MSEYIGKRYMIIKTIGKGGMADVYLALDTILNREVAIKVLKGELASDPIALERFRREAHASTCLSHPNIVDIYDVGQDGDRHYIAMEYIKGHTLKQLIQKRGALPFKEAVWLMKQLSGALMEAHRNGIIHRDVKSQNVLIKADGTIKITDFGIALAHGAMQITSEDAILGSVHYLAPEVTKGGQANMQSDIYSLGVVFFEMLTGDLPFKGDQAIQIALKHIKDEIPSVKNYHKEIPQSVENIVLKATAKDLNDRYSNVALMLQDLNNCLKPEHLNDEKVVLHKVNNDEFLSKAKIAISGEADVKEDKKLSKKKMNKILSIIYLLVAMLVSAVAIYFILLFSGIIGDSSSKVLVPDLANMSVIEANDYLADYGLAIDLSEIERVMTDDVDEGKIIDYRPKDVEVEKGSKIHVTVSSGKFATMIDYTGQNINEAQKALQQLNFKVVVKAEKSDAPSGNVIRQEGLLPNEKYNPNTLNEITLYYSEYPSIILPFGLKGRNVKDVEKELRDQGLMVELVEIGQDKLSASELEKYGPNTLVRIEPLEGSSYIQEADNKIKLYYYVQ